jgi:hypothetical protein
MIIVYHNEDFINYQIEHLGQTGERRIIEARVTPVAIVESDSMDDAYHLTNNIDDAWTKNKGVQAIGVKEFRSTSVGDILMNGMGEFYIAESAGFRRLSDEELKRITVV